MNKTDELYGDNGLMVEFIDNAVLDKDGNLTGFTDRGKAIIREIADYARSNPLYEKTKEEREQYCSHGPTADNVYVDMLLKVLNAPFTIYRDMTVLMLMPVLDQLING